jgi:hypothetical protein
VSTCPTRTCATLEVVGLYRYLRAAAAQGGGRRLISPGLLKLTASFVRARSFDHFCGKIFAIFGEKLVPFVIMNL